MVIGQQWSRDSYGKLLKCFTNLVRVEDLLHGEDSHNGRAAWREAHQAGCAQFSESFTNRSATDAILLCQFNFGQLCALGNLVFQDCCFEHFEDLFSERS